MKPIRAATGSSAAGGLSFAEQRHPELVVKEWIAFIASGRVPKATVEATSTLLQETMARPALAAAFAHAGMTPASNLPSALSVRIIGEHPYWQPVLRANDIHAD